MTRILVVDDSEVDRLVARELLGTVPQWEVVEACDGVEGLAKVGESAPDLVLTDLQMPKMSGLELVRALREEHPSIPVVLMTAQGSEEVAVQALQAGAANYVPKRVLSRELVGILRRVFDVSREEKTYMRLMSHIVGNEIQFSLTNDLALIGSLVNFLRQEVRQMQICDQNEQFRVAVALEEALMNAYYHGNLEVDSKLREQAAGKFHELAEQRRAMPPYRDRRIHVHVTLVPNEAKFVIRDEGPGFDPSSLPDPTDAENLSRPCGRGVLLMRAFMDHVEYNATGNQVTLVKRTPASVLEHATIGDSS